MMPGPSLTRLMRIRHIDPGRPLETGQTVLELFRVADAERGDGATHLMFRDHRGWYCADGRDCPDEACL